MADAVTWSDWFQANADRIATLFLIFVLALISAAGKMLRRPPEPPKMVELAGAVIDSTSAKAIVTAVNANTAALLANTEIRKGQHGDVMDQIDEIHGRLERIHEKMIEGVASVRRM